MKKDVSIHVRLSSKMLEMLEREAEKRGISVSDLIRYIIVQWLEMNI